MSACCVSIAFVISILFYSLNNPVPNTHHAAFAGIGEYEVDILCKLLDKTSIR